jgi:hypothetical protein
MNDIVKRLEERVRRLKHDHYAHKDWQKVRLEIEKRGGRWRAENGMTFELRDGAIYQYLSDHVQGVSQLIVTNLNAPVPYVAELDMDLQGTPPSARFALLKELSDLATRVPTPPIRLITIVKGDWLSKISQARWGTIQWQRYLKPTPQTLAARRACGKPFNPDLIYPGDTFEIIA